MAKRKKAARAGTVKTKPRGGVEIKAALLAAADSLFGQKGPDAVSIRDIAAEADLIPALIHRYFGTKDELIRQVLRGHVAIFREASTEHFPRAVVGSMFKVMSENPAFLRILAYLLLDGHRPEEYLTQDGGIANLVSAFDESRSDDAKLDAAFLAAQMTGWLLFEPFLLYACGYTGSAELARNRVYAKILESAPGRASKHRQSPVARKP